MFIDSVQFMWELIFTWSLSVPKRIDWWLSTIFDSTTGDLALKKKKRNSFGVFTAFIFYFKSSHTTTNSKYFSPVSEVGDTKLIPIKLATLNVLEVQRPCLPKPMLLKRFDPGSRQSTPPSPRPKFLCYFQSTPHCDELGASKTQLSSPFLEVVHGRIPRIPAMRRTFCSLK